MALAANPRMPFKSKAQRRKFAHLLVEGKITDEQYERWNRTTGRKELPEHVKRKRSAAGARRSAGAAARSKSVSAPRAKRRKVKTRGRSRKG